MEAAYDILLMQSLEKRFAGKVSDNSVKFADVRKRGFAAPPWVASALKAAPVAVERPPASALASQAAVFAALAAWTYAAGLSQPADPFSGAGGDVPGLQLAAGFGASLYFLRQQNVKLGGG